MFRLIILSIILLSAGVALLPHLVYVVAKVLSWCLHFKVSYRPYGYTALGMIAAWWLLFAWGHYFGRFFYEVKEVDVACEGLPEEMDGFRIVHISDLHLDGWAGKKEKLQEIVDKINAQHADAIVFTGDLVSLDESELKPFIPILKQLHSPNGVISVMGNHDYMPYNRSISKRQRTAKVKELQRMQREDLGWHLLLNENLPITLPQSEKNYQNNAPSGAGGAVGFFIGCENKSMGIHNVISRGDLKKATKGTDGKYKIILTHDPTHWRGEIIKAIPEGALTLSGHTHSGQFRVFGFSVARFIYKEYDGLYTEGPHNLHVNIGLGGTMPMRVGATPEITVLNLKRP